MAAVEVFHFEEFEPLSVRADLRLMPNDVRSPIRRGLSVAQRRAMRQARRRWRVRILVAVSLLTGVLVLSWPGHAFGSSTGTGLPSDLATSGVLASGMQYVVQPNDTIQSIAKMINPVTPAAASAALEREIGSTVVVPGEHLLIP